MSSEFVSTGRGGLYLTGLPEAVIVSMGTGTALVHAKAAELSISEAPVSAAVR